MHTGRPLLTSIAAGLGGAAEALGGAPWWTTATFFVLTLATLAVAVVQLVFPQKSEHRLAWWRDRRRHQQLRGTGPATRSRRAAARRSEESGDRDEANS